MVALTVAGSGYLMESLMAVKLVYLKAAVMEKRKVFQMDIVVVEK
jgi:hypothetical protein